MLRPYLRLLRLYFVLLAITTGGRLLVGLQHPYAEGSHYFSIVTVTVLCALLHGAFARRWLGFRLSQAALLALLMGVASQLVIFTLTAASYLSGVDTYFNHPTALNVTAPIPMGEAMLRRTLALFVNPLTAALVGGLGWALGGLLPERQEVQA